MNPRILTRIPGNSYDAPMWTVLKDRLAADGTVSFFVRVRPGAPKTEITDVLSDGSVKMNVAAAPEDGEANEELLRHLAETFGVAGDRLEILSGKMARRKLIRVAR